MSSIFAVEGKKRSAKLTGHKTESVYRRYAIVVEADLREGVAKLARLSPVLKLA